MSATMLWAALVIGAPALKDKEPLGKGPGYIGIMFQAHDLGMMITEIKPGSPAEKAGLRSGDVITAVEGTPMAGRDTSEFVKVVAGMRPGMVVELRIRRGNQDVGMKVKLGVRPPDFDPMPIRPVPPPIID